MNQIHSSLKVLLVSDLEASKKYYEEVIGCEVTEWWAIRDGFSGLGLKLLQANSPEDVQPNKPASGADMAVDVYSYTTDWQALDSLYEELKEKGATIVVEPWIDNKAGPWKEFVIQDPDGYSIAFGGTDGDNR